MYKEIVSVIIPVFNTKKELSRCLDSVIRQTYENIEIIIIDDGSTDGSSEICDTYSNDPRIKIIHNKNEGQAAARNVGLSMAQGEYISFIDSDDWIETNLYEKMLLQMTTSDCDMGIFNYKMHYNSAVTKNKSLKHGIFNRQELIIELLRDKSFKSFMWNKIFRRKLFHNVSFPKGRIMEDYTILPSVFTNVHRAVVINDYLYNYNMSRGTSTSNVKNIKFFADVFMANSLRIEDFGERYGRTCPELYSHFGGSIYMLMVNFIDLNRKEKNRYKVEYFMAKKQLKKYYIKMICNSKTKLKLKMQLTICMIFPKTIARIRKIVKSKFAISLRKFMI